jgi:hypothetical protein
MFSLEKLKVYDRALASVATLSQLSASWDKRHAVVDQLLRASESVVINLAEGARLHGSPQRARMLDYGWCEAIKSVVAANRQGGHERGLEHCRRKWTPDRTAVRSPCRAG